MPRFVPRQRKHKARVREESEQNGFSNNTNQLQIVPESKSEREERKRRLRDELRAGQLKISSKKQKRLDKYIENKLKKEESLELLKKLSQERIDTSRLQSSKNLGKRTFDQYATDGVAGNRRSIKVANDNANEFSDVESEVSFEQDHADAFDPIQGPQDEGIVTTSTKMIPSGGGLKQPLKLDVDGLPIIQTRHKKKKSAAIKPVLEKELPWEGFDSENERENAFDLELSEDEMPHLLEDGDSENLSEESDSEDYTNSVTSSDTSEGSYSEDYADRPQRGSGFKAWATDQINKSLGYAPSNALSDLEHVQISQPNSEVRNDEVKSEQLKRLESKTEIPTSTRTIQSISVERSAMIQESRMKLPIVAEEQRIMEAIHNNLVSLIWGETGSGKTTQVPQFLFEVGYGSPGDSTPGMIGITQPRRVAAASMAQRVRHELAQYGHKVTHQIRFENKTTADTAIKFMTDGILLRELGQDLLLEKYSAIIIDEAHERSINTDILIGMLSRLVPYRAKLSENNPNIKPLKLVIMSATLNTTDLLSEKLFRTVKPPVVKAEGRQYPVVTHFARETRQNYIDEVTKKVVRGHRKLPAGGMLVFLTGQDEIRSVLRNLEQSLLERTPGTSVLRPQFSTVDTPIETEDLEIGGFEDAEEETLNDIDILTGHDEDEDVEEFDISPYEIEEERRSKIPSAAHVLPLYSQLPTKEQMRVFDAPPDDARLIVLATNVAETSLTIPGIRYVFDCGRSKERIYNQETGVQSFTVGFISKASAEQRRGRAGRTGPGHCYRLYTSAMYEGHMPAYAEPEILRMPIEAVVLQIKGFRFPGNIANFPFPTPPSREALVKAEKLLTNLGALTASGEITKLGEQLSFYPVSPRVGKMLVMASQDTHMINQAVAIAAALTVGEIFIPENQIDMNVTEREDGKAYSNEDYQEDQAREERKKSYGHARAVLSKNDKSSDLVKTLTAIISCPRENPGHFCEQNFLHLKAMKEVQLLSSQLFDVVRSRYPDKVDVPSGTGQIKSKDLKILKEAVASGFIDQIAIRADLAPNPPEQTRRSNRAIDVPYLPLIPLKMGAASSLEEKAIYLHPSSVLARLKPKDLPQYIVYSHLQQAQSTLVGSDKVVKTRMFPLTPIEGAQLAELARDTPLLRYSKPIGKVNVLGGGKRQECVVVPELGPGNGIVGWPLPAQKVLQIQDLKRGWVIEKFLT